MLKNSKVIETSTLKAGKWLELNEISYLDKSGQKQTWESADRSQDTGAVAIIPIFPKTKEMLFIKQFRVPAKDYIYEFPAGLIDPGHTPEETALKELYEETGYRGKLTKLFPPCFSSPGLTSEAVYIAFVEVDDELPENKNPTPALEHTEDITTERVCIEKLEDFLFKSKAAIKIDAKLCCFVLGLCYSAGPSV